ncbi:hypothetical protein Q31b_49060 [Novipirellula aureliae]|uniref:Uncharacterized protein n=1 Tax=Novipirellula aureliae TaxID=2527966 RepID=A0A5C6DK52_9BACT|nr:hypothetical protein Q31b_49060 [Novipirellula aureliae]
MKARHLVTDAELFLFGENSVRLFGSSEEFVGEKEVTEVFLGAWQSRYPLPLLLDSLDAPEQEAR